MAGYQSMWAAGQDALLNALAQRDAEARLEEDRARRAQLDAEDQADRLAMREHNRKVLESQDLDRTERRTLAAEAAKRENTELEQKQAHDRLRQDAIYAYQHAPNAEEKAKFKEILQLQFPEIKFQAPPVDREGEWKQIRDPKTGKATWKHLKPGEEAEAFVEPRAEPREAKATPGQIAAAGRNAKRDAQSAADGNRLPAGVTAEEYEQELRDQYLIDLGVDPAKHPMMKPTGARPQYQQPVAPTMEIKGVTKSGQDIDLPVEGGGGGGGRPAAAGSPPPTTPPPAPPKPGGKRATDAELQAEAIKGLEARQLQVTPEAIATVIQRLRAQGR